MTSRTRQEAADAALCMQLGADGVFVGSGIFKAEDPSPRAKAIGLSAAALRPEELLETRGW